MDLQVIGLAILALIAGAVFCFAGFKFFLFLLPIWGFFAGLLAGAHGFTAIFGDGFLATTAGWVVGFVIGIGFAVFSYLFYWVAVVLLGASIGYAIGYGIMDAIGFDLDLISWLIAIAVGVVFAVGTVILRAPKYLVVLLTAFGGATAMMAGIFLIFGLVDVDGFDSGILGATLQVVRDNLIWIVVWIALGVAGLYLQLRISPEEREIEQSMYRY